MALRSLGRTDGVRSEYTMEFGLGILDNLLWGWDLKSCLELNMDLLHLVWRARRPDQTVHASRSLRDDAMEGD